MREEFEKLVAAGKITRQHLDTLVKLATSGYCNHRSWGMGRITTVDVVFCRFTIDFQAKPGHSMDLTFAAESLKPIPSTDIRARKMANLTELKQMAALHHLDLIKLVLESFGGKATIDQIQQMLVPDVIADDWKKWWEVARTEMKRDGHFQLPLKKSAPIVYQAAEVRVDDRLLADFRASKGLKNKLVIAHEVLRTLDDLTRKEATVADIRAALNADIVSHQRTLPALALEAIFLRDELRELAGAPPISGELEAGAVWSQVPRPTQVIDALPAAKFKRGLHSYRQVFPDAWVEVFLGGLNGMSAKLCGECASLLIQDGYLEKLKEHLARLIAHHQASAELLLWLGKERSDSFADILGPEVFRAMLTAMERDQFNEKRSNRLRDFILDDHQLLIELLGSADLEVIKDVTVFR
jgi:transcription elongation factor GreA-like protein